MPGARISCIFCSRNDSRCHHKIDVSVSDIVRFAGVPPQYFSSPFMKTTGRTMRQNLIAFRLNHVRELFEDPRHPVKDVAVFNGWCSQFYFGNSCRLAFGIPPRIQYGAGRSVSKSAHPLACKYGGVQRTK